VVAWAQDAVSESPPCVQLFFVAWVLAVTREPVPVIPTDCRYGATVVSRRAMPVSSGVQASPAVTSEREKNSVRYRWPAAAVAPAPRAAPPEQRRHRFPTKRSARAEPSRTVLCIPTTYHCLITRSLPGHYGVSVKFHFPVVTKSVEP